MADLADLEDAIRARVAEIVDNAARVTMEATRDAAPLGKSGDLRDSHGVDPPVDSGNVASADLYADAPYAGFVAEGTRPHQIVPVSAKALRFEVGGDVVFAARVNHPGTAPNPEWWSEEAIQARWTPALENEVS